MDIERIRPGRAPGAASDAKEIGAHRGGAERFGSVLQLEWAHLLGGPSAESWVQLYEGDV